MQEYNKLFPVDPPWERTNESLLTEWDLHNFAYNADIIGVVRHKTGDADFNNSAE